MRFFIHLCTLFLSGSSAILINKKKKNLIQEPLWFDTFAKKFSAPFTLQFQLSITLRQGFLKHCGKKKKSWYSAFSLYHHVSKKEISDFEYHMICGLQMLPIWTSLGPDGAQPHHVMSNEFTSTWINFHSNTSFSTYQVFNVFKAAAIIIFS